MEVMTISLALLAILFVLVLELVRREKLTFKYAFAWLLFSAVGIAAAVYPRWVYALAGLAGFRLPSNFLFSGLLCALVFLSLLLTVFLCQQSRRNDRMAQKIGLLEQEIDALKKDEPGSARQP
jgi:hypothetical protein